MHALKYFSALSYCGTLPPMLVVVVVVVVVRVSQDLITCTVKI